MDASSVNCSTPVCYDLIHRDRKRRQQGDIGMADALGRAFRRPLFVAGVAVLAAAWIARIAAGSSLALLAGGLAAAVLISLDIARTRRHGY